MPRIEFENPYGHSESIDITGDVDVIQTEEGYDIVVSTRGYHKAHIARHQAMPVRDHRLTTKVYEDRYGKVVHDNIVTEYAEVNTHGLLQPRIQTRS